MQFVVDAREALVSKRGGKGVYTEFLLRALVADPRVSKVFLLIESGQNLDCQDLLKLSGKFSVVAIPGKGLLWHFRAMNKIRRDYLNCRLVSTTSFIWPCFLSLFEEADIWVVVHDLITFLFPKEHNTKANLIERMTLPILARIKTVKFITVSDNTKNDLLAKFPKLSANRVFRAHPGLTFTEDKANKTELEKDNQQILAVGTLIPRKNLAQLVRVFLSLIANEPRFTQLKLNIVGGAGWESSALEEALSADLAQKHIVMHGYLGTEALEQLYRDAAIFVFPSLYEGFGLPMLEAMASGCAILASERGSLPEVGADAAIYFNPDSDQDFADQLKSILLNAELRAVLVEKSQQRLKEFSWQESVDLLVKCV